MAKSSIKTYILDTNILIQSPTAIFGFEDNEVVITSTTMQELDNLKNASGETGYKAREAVRVISRLLEDANTSGTSLLTGVPINCTQKKPGLFRIESNGISENLLPPGYSLEKADNRIINAALFTQNKNKYPVILITNDIAMRVNATICKLTVQGYRNEQIENKDNVYTGRRIINISDNEITKLFKLLNKGTYTFTKETLPKKVFTNTVFEINEYVVFQSVNTGYITAKYIGDENEMFRIINKTPSPMHIQPKNIGQRMALDALLAPAAEIPLVILKGPAGSAKTFLSLAAGLDQTLEGNYDKVMITRTNTLSDTDIGFLPGSLEDKMGPLVAPFLDNLESLLKNNGEEKEQIKIQIEDMLETGIIEIASIAYMRGRSLPNTYLIVDEAQNATIGQILEIITRAGEGTKVVLCGDPDQIDNPKLDRLNAGICYAAEKMKGSSLCAQLNFLKENEIGENEIIRSKLALEGAMRLTKK